MKTWELSMLLTCIEGVFSSDKCVCVLSCGKCVHLVVALFLQYAIPFSPPEYTEF